MHFQNMTLLPQKGHKLEAKIEMVQVKSTLSKHSSSLVLERLSVVYMTGEYTDLYFHCEGGTISSHKVVLAGLSDYLKNLFLACGQEEAHIYLPEIKLCQMKEFLRKVYLGGEGLVEDFIDVVDILKVCQTCEHLVINKGEVEANKAYSMDKLDIHASVKEEPRDEAIPLNYDNLEVHYKESDDQYKNDDPSWSPKIKTNKKQRDVINKSNYKRPSGFHKQKDGHELLDETSQLSESIKKENLKEEGTTLSNKLARKFSKTPEEKRGRKKKDDSPEARTCVECDKVFSYRASLLYHLKTSEKHGNAKPVTPPETRTCVECDKIFSCRVALLHHLKTSEKHQIVKPVTCEVCGKAFGTKYSYQSHKTQHEAAHPFMCSHCGKTFAKRHNRDVHERSHTGDFRFSCSYCPKKFASKHYLVQHERTHNGEKPYECSNCGKKFAKQNQLASHFRIHTGEKPYHCENCLQNFRHLGSYRNHRCVNDLEEHLAPNDEGMGKFDCEQCDYKATRKSSLKRHVESIHAI